MKWSDLPTTGSPWGLPGVLEQLPVVNEYKIRLPLTRLSYVHLGGRSGGRRRS